MRFLSNAVWGHPIIYGYRSQNPIWDGRNTLNPLGAKYKYYYGATLMYKPGSIVHLDTKGYNDDDDRIIVTLPPDYKQELLGKLDYKYIPLLYTNYRVT